ncbi:MAG: alpha-glucosidase C-terminal domain-containing protein [Acidibacillus sp.]|nr:alpha-glucosidase C-terminal domain-containing protein [Acidibacillus sp.]
MGLILDPIRLVHLHRVQHPGLLVQRLFNLQMLATFLHMQQGTPYIYQGEEIGMTNVAFERIEYYKDVEIHNLWADRVIAGGEDPEKLMRIIQVRGRENARTPIQWGPGKHAEFTTGEPWIQVNPNFTQINVEQALQDADSIFHYYRKLIELRKTHEVVVYGKYDLILEDHKEIYAYTRTLHDEVWLVVNNFFDGQPMFTLPEHLSYTSFDLILANYEVHATETHKKFVLQPYECRVYRLN